MAATTVRPKAGARNKAAAKPTPTAAVGGSEYTLQIRYRPDGDVGAAVQALALRVDDRAFYPEVQRWRYVVANRRRITRATRDTLADDVSAWLARQSGQPPDDVERHIKAMASSGLVEVMMPFDDESRGWAARLFPWETTLAMATRPWRDETEMFTVVRWLRCRDKRPPPASAVPSSLLLVRSGPGEIASHYALERECELVSSTLAPHLSQGVERLNEPDRGLLRAAAARMSPAVLHLAGVDPYALQKLNLLAVDESNGDGFVLRKAERGYDAVLPQEMAPLLTAGKPPPLLFAASSCFAASRLCALAVAEGAGHAIGFFDTLTDADAMLFFGHFYREWSREWDLLAAFDAARGAWLTQQTQGQASGVVLWSRQSLLSPETTISTATKTPTPAPPEPVATVDDLTLAVELQQDVGASGTVLNRTSLNYSLLHNDRSPFRTFYVDKPRPGKLPPLQVEVVLEVGSDNCRSRFAVELPQAAGGTELAPRIRLPLVAGLLRQCTESLRTNLYVRVSCGERLLRESSERVTVLPADEWRDDGEDHRWLPSFVLPRDPAVLKVIASAQRYLRTLLDDCTAGFDGYQQLAADDHNAAAVVDPQVQAIWAALQHDLPLNYINPPPSYTSRSQRLRTPSEVFRGQAATCIDLALLFASCLEFVGIYPVLFLIEGHAFPGYWRSDKAWWRMKQFHFDASAAAGTEPPLLPAAASPMLGATGGQSEGWMFDGVGNLVELLRYVQEGSLVPFESTFVAAQRGFYAALEEGSARLHPDSFDAMVDIQSARGANVTPLPLFDKFE